MKRSLVLPLAVCLSFAQSRTPAMEEAGTTNLPVQKLGVGDLIAVSVYDAPELTRTLRVDAEGAISLPLLKRTIKAEGLLPRDVEASIAAALKAEQLLVEPVVKVTIAEYFSRPISVAGAVRKPLTFQSVGTTTLLEAIARAEGLTQEAGLEILVSRAGQDLILRIPVRGLIDAAEPQFNLKLSGGEEIRVPEAGKIYVAGNVKKPGAFTVREQSEPTVLKMLALSEGLMPFAGKVAYIYRREAEGSAKIEIPVELDKLLKRKSPDLALRADDVLYIPDNSGRRVGLAALEKAILFGSTAGATALVWRR
ncbi:MAG: polysaccharide biosynthesis/export family protein, partial [Bryobacteraceae bacterium]